MQCVPWCPNRLSLNIAVYQFFGKCTQIAISQRILHFAQFRHYAIAFQLENFTARSGIHQSVCRQQMPCSVSAQFAIQRFPTAQLLYGHISAFTTCPYTGIRTETVQKPVHIYRCHPGRVTQHIIAKSTWQQTDVFQIKTLYRHRSTRFHFHLSRMLAGIYGLRCQCACHSQT